MKTNLILFLFFIGYAALGQTPCIDGKAGNYPCNKINLLSHLSPEEMWGEELNDIWGWTDPETGKEYALVGLTDGTAFVDITDPVNPIFVGKLIEHIHERMQAPQHLESAWRDLKVYKDHVFVISEQSHHGMQIFDLKRLRDVENPPMQFFEDANYPGIGNAHNIVINEETGFAYAVGVKNGTECFGSGLHIIDINDPLNPVFAGCFDDDGYTHDAQCIIYQGPDADYFGKEICFASNENTVTIVDVSDKANPVQISRTGYDNVGYTHQGWLTPDQRYFLSNDELDEINFGNNTRTVIWDLLDLDNPQVIGYYLGPVGAIDHNLYTKGELAFESNYLSGIRVVEFSKISEGALTEVAFFDTHPESNAAQFDGTWSVYPYFESGTIVASDITKGLYVLKLEHNFFLTQNPQSLISCVGGTGQMEVSLSNAVSPVYQWQSKIEGGDFENLSDNELYEGTQSSVLAFTSINEAVFNRLYRCQIVDQEEVVYSESAEIQAVTIDFEYSTGLNQVNFLAIASSPGSISWDFGDGNASTDTNPTHVYDESGVYQVSLTLDTEGCGEITIQKDIEVMVLGLGKVGDKISFFPNPAENKITLQSEEGSLLGAEIQITALDGKLIQEEMVKTADHTFELKLNTLEAGMYLLLIKTGNHQYQHKLFIK